MPFIKKGWKKELEMIIQLIKSGELSYQKIAEITHVPLEKSEALAKSNK